jgi:hypothetical protein
MVKKIFLILDNTKISKFFQKNIFIKSFFIIFLCWLPIWLCFWPGIYEYDIPYQFQECISGHITNYHPVLYKLYFYHCISFGKTVFGSAYTGILIYVIPQLLTFILVISYLQLVLSRNKIPILLQLFSLIFFALYPVHPIFAISTVKDTFFVNLHCCFLHLCANLFGTRLIFLIQK